MTRTFYYKTKVFQLGWHSVRLVSTLILVVSNLISIAQIVNIENLRTNPNDTARLKGNVQSSFYYKNASDVLFSLNARSFVSYRFNKQMILLSGDWGITKAGSQDFENQAFLHFRYNKSINNWLVGEAFTQVQQNKVLNVRFRYLAGAGPRFEVIKKKNITLNIGTLYMYEYEQPIGDSLGTWVKNRISSYLALNFKINKTTTFSCTTYYQPNLANVADYRILGQYKLLISITKKFSLKAESNIIYDTQPVAGAVKSYSDFMFGCSLDF